MLLITAKIGEISFIKQINTGYFNHTPGQTPGPGVDDQLKIHYMFIACFFLFVSVEFGILLVCFIEFVCFDFCDFPYFLFLSGGKGNKKFIG